jgi:hypothetical protein
MKYVPTRRLSEDDVQDPEAFCDYAHAVLGVPFPSIKDQAVLRKKIKEFFAQYPQADYRTLCRIVQWAKTHHKRPYRIWLLIDLHRQAWADKAVPELDMSPVDVEVERGIKRALEIEQDSRWRRRLMRAHGSGRKEVLEEWRKEQSQSSR